MHTVTVHLTVLQPSSTEEERLEYCRRRNRRQREVRATTINMKRSTKIEQAVLRVAFPEASAPYWRPETRADCADVPRPCPYVGCVHHLYLDVSQRTGAIKLNFPDLEPGQMSHSCALDVAEEGGATLDRIAPIMNLTRERVRQIERWAIDRRKDDFEALREQLDE